MFRPWTHTSDDSYIYQLSFGQQNHFINSAEDAPVPLCTAVRGTCGCIVLPLYGIVVLLCELPP